MRVFNGSDEKEALAFIDKAREIALNASCVRSRCGAVIVKDGEIIGSGFNSPAGELESQRRCPNEKSKYDMKVTDKTCCVHAEQRAVFDALRENPEKIEGSRIYFIRLDENGEKKFSGEPYCTICSKTCLDVGVKEFVLYKKEGVCVFDTSEYNDLSYGFSSEGSSGGESSASKPSSSIGT